MKFWLTLLFSIIFCVNFEHCELTSLRSQSTPRESSSSTLLRKENSSFKMDVNFEGSSPVKMLFTLHKSVTLLVSTCLNFEPFDCLKYQCQKYLDEATEYDFPYFRSYGYLVESDIFLGNHDWGLKTKTILGQNCTQGIHTYGNGTSGIIGLGLGNSARKNYKTPNPIFTTFYENDNLGWLSFSKNLSQAKSTSAILSFSADDNWQILGGQGVMVDNKIVNQNLFPVILDTNSDTLGFPQDTFNDTIAYFNNKRSLAMICPINTEKDYHKPVCRYQGLLQNLPNIILWIQGKKLVISPWQYVEDASNYDRTKGYVVLNLRALKTNSPSSNNYVIDQYDGHVIIGFNFIKDYVMTFEAGAEKNHNIIEIYEKLQKTNAPRSSTIYWIAGGLFSIVVVSVIVWICRKKKPQDAIVADPSLQDAPAVPLLQGQDEGVQVSKMKDENLGINDEFDRQGFNQSGISNILEEIEEDFTEVESLVNKIK